MSGHAGKRAKLTGRGKGGSFVAMPHVLLESPAFRVLSGRATKVLLYLASQYKGNNNGDLHCAWSLIRKQCGWKSHGSLRLAIQELEQSRLIVRTRRGGKNRASLYALGWFALDANPKLDYPWDRGTNVAPNEWRRLPYPLMDKPYPPVVQSGAQQQASGKDLSICG